MSLRIRLIASPGGVEGASQFLMSYLIDDRIAVDAGSLGFYGSPHEQAAVRDVLISHSHIDHIASLPVFLENTHHFSSELVTIYGNSSVVECLKEDIFNDRVVDREVVDLTQSDRVRLQTIVSKQPIQLDDVRITPITVNHVVPTLGFIIEKNTTAVVIASDTGPTDEIWTEAAKLPNLRGVFLEATFPDTMMWLAEVSKHLTPALLRQEIQKLPECPLVIAVHIKARFYQDVVRELQELKMPNLVIGEPGKEYSF